MLKYVMMGVQEGVHVVYAPVVWGTNAVGSTEGKWINGVGMIAFFFSDFEDALNSTLPMLGKVTWGKENDELRLALAFHTRRLGFSVIRSCCPYLWLMYHPKASWLVSPDGREVAKAVPWSPQSDWKLDEAPPLGPETLLASGQLQGDTCLLVANGDLLL